MRADLHMHSSFSDGVCSPEDLLARCRKARLDCFAITDHDSFAGSDQLSDEALDGIRLIRGIELSLCDQEGLHLLAYGRTDAKPLRAAVAQQAEKRLTRAGEMLRLLDAQGIHLEMEELTARAQGTICRPHIAQALVQHGYAHNIADAFARYLNPGCAAYVPTERLCMEDALRLVRESGFVPVLAHPCELELPLEHLHALLRRYQDMGLMGVEVYHPSARKVGSDVLAAMVRPMGFLVTGGSDFHRERDRHGEIGCMCAEWRDAERDARSLCNAMEEQKEYYDQSRTNG